MCANFDQGSQSIVVNIRCLTVMFALLKVLSTAGKFFGLPLVVSSEKYGSSQLFSDLVDGFYFVAKFTLSKFREKLTLR